MYIQRKEQEHIDGNLIKPDELMDFALKQYQTLVQKKVWGDESAEHKEIMSLQQKLNTANKNDSTNKVADVSDAFRKLTADEYRKLRFEKAPKWMKQKPTDIKQKLKRGNNEYIWCTYHKLWQKHSAVDCRLNPLNKDRQQPNNENTQAGVNKKKKEKSKTGKKIAMPAVEDDEESTNISYQSDDETNKTTSNEEDEL